MAQFPITSTTNRYKEMIKIELRVFRKTILFFLLGILVTGCGVSGSYIEQGRQNYVPIPKTEEIDYSVFLVGDAGAPDPGIKEPVLKALQDEASELGTSRSSILFLGDNIYEYGMPDTISSERIDSERRLDEQIDVAIKSKTRGIFIPGNHDWKQGKSDGLHSLRNQESYIELKKSQYISQIPSKGCPGPDILDLGDNLRLIILDTQWLLQEREHRPETECKTKSEDEVYKALSEAISTSGSRKVLVAAHHPPESNGPHGGFFPWYDHIFPLRALNKSLWIPLPVIGSIYPLARNLGITRQDMSNGYYHEMADRLNDVFSKNKSVIFTAGHDHSLQVLNHVNGSIILVSGAGSDTKITPVTKSDNTIFARSHTGFMRVDYLKNGKVRIGVIIPTDKTGSREEVFSMWFE